MLESKSRMALALLSLICLSTILHGQAVDPDFSLDESWTVTVAGQSVNVNPDGSFLIPNISAPDQFGANGPNSPPDFLSDDFVRLIGFSTQDGVTRYVYSAPFQLQSGETFVVEELILTFSPPPFPEDIRAQTETPTLTEIGQTTQVKVSGTLIDNSTIDVSPAARGTSYRTSNAEIIQVDGDGLVTAVSKGTGFITAINEGATTVLRIDVSPGDELTTIAGVVINDDGQPVANAEVRLLGAAGTTASAQDGSFRIEGVSTANAVTAVLVRTEGDTPTLGISTQIQLVPGGFSDAGIISPINCADLNISDCLDTDGDCLPDVVERQLGLDPNLADTDGDGLTDGEEDNDNDGLSNCLEIVSRTDPRRPDTDQDGLSDGDEVFLHASDPTRSDTDGEGLSDGEELALGTNLRRADSDGDGWTDEAEVITDSDPLEFLIRPRLFVAGTTTTVNLNSFAVAGGIRPGIIVGAPHVSTMVPSLSSQASGNPTTIVSQPSVSALVPGLTGSMTEPNVILAEPSLSVLVPALGNAIDQPANVVVGQPPITVGFETP